MPSHTTLPAQRAFGMAAPSYALIAQNLRSSTRSTDSVQFVERLLVSSADRVTVPTWSGRRDWSGPVWWAGLHFRLARQRETA